MVNHLDIDQRLAAEPFEFYSLVATVSHDVAHHLAGRLCSHGDGLRALLEAIETAGVAAGGGEDNVAGGGLCDGLEDRCQLANLAAGFPVVVPLWHQEPAVCQFPLRHDVSGLVGRQQHERAGQRVVEQQAVIDGLLHHVGHQAVTLTLSAFLLAYNLLNHRCRRDNDFHYSNCVQFH